MKKPKRDFRHDDRVAIYRSGVRGVGKVTNDQLGESAGVWVESDTKMLAEDCSRAHFVSAKQLRRLIKKPRAPSNSPAQEGKRVERLVRWIIPRDREEASKHNHYAYLSKEEYVRGTRLVECAPGERPISREELARAWEKSNLSLSHQPSMISATFAHFCEMLGFPEKGGE